MNKSDFFFDLPQHLIAQAPISPRDSSRLLHLDRQLNSIAHLNFSDITNLINPGDLLILNNSKVFKARLIGTNSNLSPIEILLVSQISKNLWEIIVKPGKRARVGQTLHFHHNSLSKPISAKIINVLPCGNRLCEFFPPHNNDIFNMLDTIGIVPLPPYITSKNINPSLYQTVFACDYSDNSGSIAAPTAGLHFTQQLLDHLKSRGVNIAFITLHVGIGTFRPVKTANILEHKMHSEFFSIPDDTARLISQTKSNKNRVIAVGTTSCRSLEAAFLQNPNKSLIISPISAQTDIFIYPKFNFNIVDALITNFHLPESTLLMLVSAFANRESILSAYNSAIQHNYRFFSFGDAMFIS